MTDFTLVLLYEGHMNECCGVISTMTNKEMTVSVKVRFEMKYETIKV